MRQIHAPEAWAITTGSSKVVVSINDTGVDYLNPDLYLNIWLNQKEIPFKVGKKGLADTDGDGLITFWDLNAKDNNGQLVNGKFVNDQNSNNFIDGGDLLADTRWADGMDQGRNGFKDDLIGWDFVNNDNDPMDLGYHGTFIAGIIGAPGNDKGSGPGSGVAGLSWRVQMMPVVVGDAEGFVTDEAALSGIYYSADNGAQISNHSYSGDAETPETDRALSRAIEYARKKGQLFVAAAGNDAVDIDIERRTPAGYPHPNIIAVAATGSNNEEVRAWELDPSENDKLNFFSNYGKKSVDLGAPGWDIPSYVARDYKFIYVGDGTSFAAPHVVGTAALLLAKYPKLDYAQLKKFILESVDPLTDLAGKTVTGGRLNVYKALVAASGKKPHGAAHAPPFKVDKVFDFSTAKSTRKSDLLSEDDPAMAILS